MPSGMPKTGSNTPLPAHLGAALEAARVQGRGQVQAAQKIGSARRKRGLFQTLGTIAGAIGGFVVGGPQGAVMGSQLGGTAGGALSGVNPQVGTTPMAQDLQTMTTLGAQLSSYGFSAPPQTTIPSLGSQAINPFQQSPSQVALGQQLIGGGRYG